MQILVALKTAKLIINILRSKVFWIIFTIFVIWIASTFSAFGFFINYAISETVDEAKAQANEKADSIKSLYEEALSEQTNDPNNVFGTPVPDFTPRPENPINPDSSGGGSVGGGSSDYDDTKDYADSIEGTSVLHQVHNAIVDTVNVIGEPWFTYSLIFGTNMKEANGFGGSWIPHIGADKLALTKPDFNLKTAGVNSITNFNDIKYFYYDKKYIGPFQTDYVNYTTHHGRPGYWDLEKWKQVVADSDARVDGNGDGKSDPFNYYDGLIAMRKHYQGKYDLIKNVYQVNTQQDLNDMLTMQVAARYVGIDADPGSTKKFGSHGPYKYYPHSEELNPHIQLMRKAIDESKNGGPHYTKLKNIVAQNKSVNGETYSKIINEFYAANGWQVNSLYDVQWNFSDGTKMRLQGQNVHYVFLVYWGGMVAQQEITRILKSGGQ